MLGHYLVSAKANRLLVSQGAMNTQADKNQQEAASQPLVRITHDPQVMPGKACIRGMRVTG